MSGRRTQAALLSGLALLGGISSLLLPIDDILPLEVRRLHIAEIFGSNFLFGVIAALDARTPGGSNGPHDRFGRGEGSR